MSNPFDRIVHTRTLSVAGLMITVVLFGAVGLHFLIQSHAAPSTTGDINGDGKVNIFDLSAVLTNYGSANSADDVNGDGSVNITDLSIILSNYGKASMALPPVAGKNTSYNLGVLVIKYFPLTANGQNIDITVTGDVGDTYATVRQNTINYTNNLLTYLPKATKYLSSQYSGDPPSLNYHVVATKEYTQAVPIKARSGFPTYPDYNGMMVKENICNYVDNQGVREVWLWAYQGPSKPGTNYPYLGIFESKMSGPYGDISNSYEFNDMPICTHTYRVYTFNYGRGTAEAAHSWGHQIEWELRAVDSNLFGLFQGPNYPQTLGVNGRCGSVHNPPNARYEYDWSNSISQPSDCLDWTPDSLGNLSNISCTAWGCGYTSDTNNDQLNWQVWMWQNLPGMNNTKTYQGKQLRNWWDVHGNFDSVMGSSKRLTYP